ncbi:MAG: S-layer homology domain-containing protein [Schwartzia sp.]|nr:S-layer homology domain-containing protein [Schwartzia sp. (in: firmicutes)]
MKKSLVSALTTALVVGAASTTFAAANPFEDVPADHWAYDAIAQLAADGVIEGYGDGTYRGDQEITRYEMAQMIARAMAKGANGADKALVDKLAAEFADELNNLGVRVAALEKKVDNVKWTGMVRYRYINRHEEGQKERPKNNTNGLLLRLEPQMTINKNWTAKARIDYEDTKEMDSAANMSGDKMKVDRVWVEGKYNNFLIKLGKFNVKTASDYGMTLDYRIAGAEAVVGKDVQVALRGGRLNLTDSTAFAHGGTLGGHRAAVYNTYLEDTYGTTAAAATTAQKNAAAAFAGSETASYMGLEVYNDRAKKFTWGLGWQHLRGDYDHNLFGIGDNINIFDIGLGYKFTKDLRFEAAYAFATGLEDAKVPAAYRGFDESKYKYSYSFEFLYKGAVPSKQGSWGLNLAYRHLGDVSVIHPTAKEFGPQYGGEKGIEFGGSWTIFKNIVARAKYFNGKTIASEKKTNSFWSEVCFYF